MDIVYKKANQLIPIEIKSSKTFNQRFLKEIDYFSQLFPEQCSEGYLVYAGKEELALGWRQLVNYLNINEFL